MSVLYIGIHVGVGQKESENGVIAGVASLVKSALVKTMIVPPVDINCGILLRFGGVLDSPKSAFFFSMSLSLILAC